MDYSLLSTKIKKYNNFYNIKLELWWEGIACELFKIDLIKTWLTLHSIELELKLSSTCNAKDS